MRKTQIIIICLAALLFLGPAWLKLCWDRTAPSLPAAPVETARLEQLWVHGESALLGLGGQPAANLTLKATDSRANYVFSAPAGAYVNRGLKLWQMEPGCYQVFYQEDRRLLPVDPGRLFLPQGYTLPRQGSRLHWQFSADSSNLLYLTLEAANTLPAGYFDVILDAGHGGRDTGAAANGRLEAPLNLENALELRQYLTDLGLSVALTRDSAAVPGGEAAEDNPYARGARVERIYASHGPYLLSCHLNAGGGEGFQIYSSVESDGLWARLLAQQWLAVGLSPDNGGNGRVAEGLYQRGTPGLSSPRDYYFILRETGGYALSPAYFIIGHRDLRQELAVGAEGLLLEFAFMDNEADMRRWLELRSAVLFATAQGCADYWQL